LTFSRADIPVLGCRVVQRVFCGLCGGDGRQGAGGEKSKRDGWRKSGVKGFHIKLFLNSVIILWIECFSTTY